MMWPITTRGRHRTPSYKMLVIHQPLPVWGMQQISIVVGLIFVNSTSQNHQDSVTSLSTC